LLKNTPPERLADAIRTISRGNALIAPEVTRSPTNQDSSNGEPDAEQPDGAEHLGGEVPEQRQLDERRPCFSSNRNASSGDSQYHTSAALRPMMSASRAAAPVTAHDGTNGRPSTNQPCRTALPTPEVLVAPIDGSSGRPVESSRVASSTVAASDRFAPDGAANRVNG
jgi:hypothetical protein